MIIPGFIETNAGGKAILKKILEKDQSNTFKRLVDRQKWQK